MLVQPGAQCGRSAFRDTGSLTHETGRDFHFDLAVCSYAQKIRVKDDFTYWVKLHFLQDGFALVTFDVQVYKVSFVRVNDVTEQDNRRFETTSSVQGSWSNT